MQNLVYDLKSVFSIRNLLENSVDEYGDRTAFLFHDANSTVIEKTYTEAAEDTKRFAVYLNSLGLENKKVAIMGKNCYEWAITYLAVCCGVGVIVPIDKELKPHELAHIIEQSECSAIVYTPDIKNTVDSLTADIKKINTEDFQNYLELGQSMIDTGDKSYENHIVQPKALGILLYTSGTMGVSKGVMLSQYNICANIIGVRKSFMVSPEDRVLSVLPLHHIYESMAGFLTILYSGASIAYARSLRTLVMDMQLFKPTLLVSVPLLLESIHKNIMKKIHGDATKRAVFSIGKGLGNLLNSANIDVRRKIFAEIHENFGGRLRAFICGAAPLPPNVFRFFDSIGIRVYIGYGLTETSPISIMHSDNVRDPETTGLPTKGVKIKLDSPNADGIGEILVKGDNVMLGYYKMPEETAEVLQDGWFHTGDLGCLTKNGHYRIMGRLKNMIVTPNGKKIFPEELEYYLQKSDYVQECLVYGGIGKQGDTVVEAIIYPNFEAVNKKLAEEGVTEGSEQYIEKRNALFLSVIKEANSNLPQYKMIRKFSIRREEFIKTTTKKIKRGIPENIQSENTES